MQHHKKCILLALAGLLFLEGWAQKALFLAAGQSNAVGMGNVALSIQVPHGAAFEYKYEIDSCVPLKDPVGENRLNFQQARSGSLWPSFAKSYYYLTNRQVVIVPTAMGGSSCSHKAETNSTWDSIGKRLLLDSAVKKSKAAEGLLKQKIDGIIWLQGERDANAIYEGKLTAEEYRLSLISVINRFRSKLGYPVPFFIVLTGNQMDRPFLGNEAVRKMQEDISRDMAFVYIVYKKTKGFKQRKLMKDKVHYNQDALNEIGKEAAKNIYNIQRRKRSFPIQ
jgi:hypothetical protein